MKINALYAAAFVLAFLTPTHAFAAAADKAGAGQTAPSCGDNSLTAGRLPWQPTQLEDYPRVKTATAGFVLQLVANFENLKTANNGVAPTVANAIAGSQLGFADALIVAAVTPANIPPSNLSSDVVASCRAASITGNTNKQTGATAAAEGTTSTTELTGIPELLSIAVENGAVTNTVNGSTMTLGTSLYGALLGFHLIQDSSHDYKSCYLCVRIGSSATFNIADNSDPLASARRKQVSQWQLKYSFRDQSNRSSKVSDLWTSVSASEFAAAASPNNGVALGAETTLAKIFVDYVTGLKDLETCIDAISANNLLKTPTATCSMVKGATTQDGLATVILQGLDSDSTFQNALAAAQAVPELKQFALNVQTAQAKYNNDVKKFEAAVDNLSKGFNADITFEQQFPTTSATSSMSSTSTSAIANVFHADPTATTASTHIPDYLVSGLDLSWQPKAPTDASAANAPTGTAPSLTFNAKSSFYTKPNPALNEKTFRGATAAFQAQWTLGGSPFVSDPNDKSKVTLAASGSYQRLQENKDEAGKRPDIALGSIKLTIPFPSGISFPIAVTVGSAQQQQAKGTYVNGNFGLSFDVDKFAALLSLKR